MLNYQRVPHVAWIHLGSKSHFLSWKWRQQIQRSRSRILSEVRSPTTYHKLIWLVVSTPLKNISQLGWLFNMQQVPLGSLGTGPDDPDVCRIHLRHLLHLHANLWDTFAGHFLVSHIPGGRSNWRGTEMNWVCFFLQWTCHTGWWLSHPSEKYEFVSWDYGIPN